MALCQSVQMTGTCSHNNLHKIRLNSVRIPYDRLNYKLLNAFRNLKKAFIMYVNAMISVNMWPIKFVYGARPGKKIK